MRLQARKSREARAWAARQTDEPEGGGRVTNDLAQTVATALARLPAEQREIVELKTYGGLTLREIAEVTALPPGTVATRYRTAITRLRESLSRKCHD